MTSTPKTQKPDLRIVLSFKDEHSTFGEPTLHVNAHVVVITEEGIRNPSPWGYDEQVDYAGLGIQGHQKKGDSDFIYGQPYPEYYDVYNVDLRRAERMVKTLRRLTKSIDKSNERLGWPRSLSQTLIRFALALGCKDARCFGWANDRNSPTYDGSGYKWVDATVLDIHIDRIVKEWKDKYGYAEVEAS